MILPGLLLSVSSGKEKGEISIQIIVWSKTGKILVMERLQKVLAMAGVASRRGAEDLIRQGRVSVNGRRAIIGQQVDPARDRILVDGAPVRIERKVYYAFYKPKGVLTTMRDERGRPAIGRMPRIEAISERVFPVGRLDRDAEGLLLLTNDGELANRLLHPRFGVQKTYQVRLDRVFDAGKRLRKGVVIDGRRVAVSGLRCRGPLVVLSVHEGRKHVIKRIFLRLGYRVRALRRIQVGPVRLEGLEPGGLRPLSPAELEKLGR